MFDFALHRSLVAGCLALTLTTCAWGQDPVPDALVKLASQLPAPNQFVSLDALGIAVFGKGATQPVWHWAPPLDLDTRQTDSPDLTAQFPDLHLNLPLEVQPGMVNNLFMSDQPEEIRDDRLRDNSTPGATGIYSAADISGQAPLRVLMDQTNGTSRPLKLWLVWVPQQDGVLMFRQRGASVDADSVNAGAVAFEQAMQVTLMPRTEVQADTSVAVEAFTLPPGATAVVHDTLVCTSPGQIFSVVTEADATGPPSPTELAALPVLHSVVWKEEEKRLGKFINPQSQPNRYERILNSFQHARGRFHFPDRVAHAAYAVDSWQLADHPLQVYSMYESIPGADRTTSGGAETDNRGRYGALARLELSIQALPPGCDTVAVVALNTGNVWGGRHITSDGLTREVDSVCLLHGQPGLLRSAQAEVLWQGPVHPGSVLSLSTEPMANISVALWYLVVPIPPAVASTGSPQR